MHTQTPQTQSNSNNYLLLQIHVYYFSNNYMGFHIPYTLVFQNLYDSGKYIMMVILKNT